MSYGNRNYYRPSMFGGFQFFPPVVKMLLITNTAVFVLLLFLGEFSLQGINLRALVEYFIDLRPLGYGFYPWQLITYQFVHAGFWHLFFNMVFGLWMFGMEVEHVWGARKFLIYYLFCGVMAGLAQLFLAPLFGQIGPTVGASGAIFGVMVAFAVMFPDRYIFLYFLIPIKVKYFVIVLIALGIFALGGPSNVANLAHLGGALAGYLYLVYDRRRLTPRRSIGTFQSWMASKPWSRPTSTGGEIVDAKVYDIKESEKFEQKEKPDEIQKRIDEILDKISRNGYQSLTEEEKKILFEASKRMN
jgi:membrane associated rhomboid family serine protease